MKITSVEQSLYELLGDPIASSGYELVRIKFNSTGKAPVLQIMIDHPDEGRGINLDDCETVSRYVSNILDVEDPIATNYNLEVSSPGLDRPLVFIKDFDKYKGSKVVIKTQELVGDSKKIKGYILGVSQDEMIEVRLVGAEQPNKKKKKAVIKEEVAPEIVEINYNDIVSANIICDELV